MNTVFTGMDYARLRKVYSIWILPGLDEKGAKKMGTINRYRMTEENLFGGYTEDESNYDKLEIIIIGLEEDMEFGYDSFDDMESDEEKINAFSIYYTNC